MLSNHEIVVIAAYLVGAGSERMDTEDIAVKANEIAPGRFTWRKYPEQISIDSVRKRLWDACKEEKGGYMRGSEKSGWLLTECGVKFARKNAKAVIGKKQPKSLKERSRLKIERQRLLATDAFSKYESGQTLTISLREAESFFRIDNYVAGAAREEKVLRILNAFGEDSELGPLAKTCAELVRGATKE